MKKFLFLLIVSLQSILWSGQASAAPCGISSLGAYVALGASGCSIGAVTFSDFARQASQTNAIPSTAVTVTPLMIGGTMVGFRFDVSPTASGGNFYDNPFTYRVTGVGANLVGAAIDFAGSSVTGDAAVSVSEQLCIAGVFSASCSTGATINLAAIDVGFQIIDDPVAFNPVGFLSVASQLTYDSGSGFVQGSGSTLTSGTNLFSFVTARVVPEPATGMLVVLGALGLVLSRRRTSLPRGA